jgi:hypothetical protein
MLQVSVTNSHKCSSVGIMRMKFQSNYTKQLDKIHKILLKEKTSLNLINEIHKLCAAHNT